MVGKVGVGGNNPIREIHDHYRYDGYASHSRTKYPNDEAGCEIVRIPPKAKSAENLQNIKDELRARVTYSLSCRYTLRNAAEIAAGVEKEG